MTAPSRTGSARVVAVTGAGSGIGREVALALSDGGTTVIGLDRDAQRLTRLVDEAPSPLVPVVADAATAAGNAAMRDAALHAGGLDGLVCCVGVFDQYAKVCELEPPVLEAAFDEIFTVNVRSVLHAVVATHALLADRHGAIVLTLSGSAFYAEGGGVLYGASKGALRGALLHLARELAPEIRVNAVAPGGVTSTAIGGLRALHQVTTAADQPDRDAQIRSRSPLEVLTTPKDVAASYLFLLGPQARTMTGCTLHPDGGLGAVR